MPAFREKAIWIWNDVVIGTPAQVAQRVKEAGFEAAYLHSTNVGNWRTASRVALVSELKKLEIAVYASAAVYAQVYTAPDEGHRMAAIVNQYQLAGAVFDVEAGKYEDPTSGPVLARELITAYKQMTAQPCAFCGWALYEGYHPVGVLVEGMKLADVGMPMAYWYNGSTPAAAVSTLESSLAQWRKYTSKPIIPAGRAYTDSYKTRDGQTVTITARGDAVTAFDARSRAMGAPGITWWDMEHALRIPDVWDALSKTPKMGDPIPEEEVNVYKDNALGYLSVSKADPGWKNTTFSFFVAHACNGYEIPNADLKPMEDQAAALGKPFVIEYGFEVGYYTGQQYPMEETKWPSFEMDYPLKMLCRVVENRNPAEVWITLANPNNHAGVPADPDWLDFGPRVFLKKFGEWKAKNKPGLKVRVITSWQFMNTYAPNRLAWLGNYATGIQQKALQPLDASYPQYPNDKPAWLGAIEGWKFWRYFEYASGQALILFNGGVDALEEELGKVITEPPAGDGDTGGSDDLSEVLALLAKFDAALARLEAAQTAQTEKINQTAAQVADIRSKFS